MLIDTHILLWAASEPERLSASQRALLEDPATDIVVSTISIVEIEIKRTIGKLDMSHSVEDLRQVMAAHWLPLEADHAIALRSLPLIHRDPFDRLLIAQALAEQVELMSSDTVFDGYVESGLRVIR